MKIAKYIADLLFEYECIVIPEFGGFITKEIPAQIHPIQNHFIPPSKEIVYNIHLKTNDGLLVNYIARKENLTYIEARTAVERFVKKCLIELQNGKQIRFRKVGLIYMDENKKVLFEPDKTQNYLADSFGLKSFVSPQVKRTIIRPTTKASKTVAKERGPKETAKREIKPKVKGPKYVNINISFILILLAISALFYFKTNIVKEYYNNYASVIPFFYSSPNEYIANNMDKPPVMSVIVLVDKLGKPNANGKVKNDTVNKNKPKVTTPVNPDPDSEEMLKQEDEIQKNLPPKKDNETDITKEIIDPAETSQTANTTDFKYFIIAGVFSEKTNAEKMRQELESKGFNAMIVDQNKRGLYRVCFNGFSNMNEANEQLSIIRREQESDAWLLSI